MQTIEDTELDSFLARLPHEVAGSFTKVQREGLGAGLATGRWRVRHPVDLRFTLPFFGRQFYVVLLGGRERRPAVRRRLDRLIRPIWTVAKLTVIATFLLLLAASSMTGFYVFKRALGIEIHPGNTLPDERIEDVLKFRRSGVQ